MSSHEKTRHISRPCGEKQHICPTSSGTTKYPGDMVKWLINSSIGKKQDSEMVQDTHDQRKSSAMINETFEKTTFM